MTRRTLLALLGLLPLAVHENAAAQRQTRSRDDETTGSGTQIRGSAGRNAQLKASPFTLKADAAIATVEDGGAGFWIEKQGGGMIKNFDKAKGAVGFRLKAGTYYVYPNLKAGQNSATVTVKFRK